MSERKEVLFTHESVAEYAAIQLEGQYLLAAHFVGEVVRATSGPRNVLVDFGCGAGKSTRAVASLVRDGGRVIGVDISNDFLATARRLTDQSAASHRVTYDYRKVVRVHGREVIPVDDESADIVTSTIVLQELQSELQLANALYEMGRIARTGAVLALACVSDKITTEDYTTFTYAGFPENASNAVAGINIRKCRSTVSSIVWEQDRHWSAETMIPLLERGGWRDLKATYPLAPTTLHPFPPHPETPWRDETRAAPLLMLSGRKA